MTTVADIMKLMDSIAPQMMKMDWDNVGLQCGSATAPVRKVLVALDPFEHVCREAAQWGADLLVTHHPLIFRPVSAVTDEAAITRGLMTLVKHEISHFCAHTNLDCAAGGVNDVLAEKLKLRNVRVIGEEHLLREGERKPCSLPDFLSYVREALDCEGLRFVDGGRPVHRIAVGGGACADSLYDVVAAGCDTFVTADVKYNQFWDAKELGLNLIDAGHFYTENPVTAMLAAKISAAFPEIQVKISESHRDCMKYY